MDPRYFIFIKQRPEAAKRKPRLCRKNETQKHKTYFLSVHHTEIYFTVTDRESQVDLHNFLKKVQNAIGSAPFAFCTLSFVLIDQLPMRSLASSESASRITVFSSPFRLAFKASSARINS